MSETKWRDEGDPEVLAAAVAAGVEVQVFASAKGWYPTANKTAGHFAFTISNGNRYRVPADWQPTPEPPADDLRERIARAIWEDDERAKRDGSDDWDAKQPTDHEVYLANADSVLAVLPVPPTDEAAGPSGPPWYLAQDVWSALGGDSNAFEAWAHHEDDRRTWGDAWAQVVAAIEGSRMEGHRNPPPGTILDLPSYQWVRESPAPSPVPPWPGAVLSGLVDEDGEPTWLAQAGQVRGEMVRQWRKGGWVPCAVDLLPDSWVEVRAPRPAAATERVPVTVTMPAETADALLTYLRDGGFDNEGVLDDVEKLLADALASDGTVEVLRRDGES